MSEPLLKEAECRHCHRPIVWIRTEAGHPYPFEPRSVDWEALPESDAWGIVIRSGQPVAKLTNGRPLTGKAMMRHRCKEYAEWRLMRNVTQVGDLTLDNTGWQGRTDRQY